MLLNTHLKYKTMQATARIYFQKTLVKRTKDNLCPVKLCVTHKRTRKYYSIVDKIKDNSWLFLSDADIEKVTCKSPHGKYRDIAFEYKRIVKEAESIINDISIFSFGQFEERFFNRVATWNNIFDAINSHIQSLKNEGRFGYASTFESTLKAIKQFHKGKLNFVDITSTWLKKFEIWMRKQGKSESTIGIYMRNIRVLFNIAIDDHKIKVDYPFKKYQPKSSTGRKIALTAYQIGLISHYQTEHPLEQFYRDMFMFSFFANGMNFTDIARLRYSNIQDDEISFIREKTKGKDIDKINVPITKTMQIIINRHGNKAVGFDSYLFPILKPELSDEMQFLTIKHKTKQLNKYLKNIARAVGIKENVSSYTARHSFATISKNSGTSIEFIKEALGHSSVNVTEAYLKSFEKSTRVEHAEKLENEINNAI